MKNKGGDLQDQDRGDPEDQDQEEIHDTSYDLNLSNMETRIT